MLDAIVDYLPSPLDIPAIEGHAVGRRGRRSSSGTPTRTSRSPRWPSRSCRDQHLGKLTYIRVYSGTLESGSHGAQLHQGPQGADRQDLPDAREQARGAPVRGAGQIVAVMGLKDTTTGDTLCDPTKPVILESMTFPAPVINVAIEPKTKGDQEKLGTAIQRLAEEDPTFQVRTDEETGQTIISGWASCTSRCWSTGCGASSRSRPTSAARRSPTARPSARKVEKVEYTHKKQTGGSGQYARVHHQPRAAPAATAARLRVREQGHRWPHPAGVHPVGGRRLPGGQPSSACWPATRWSTSRSR